ncbi:unnamed protein product, partial [Tuber aestivum]
SYYAIVLSGRFSTSCFTVQGREQVKVQRRGPVRTPSGSRSEPILSCTGRSTRGLGTATKKAFGDRTRGVRRSGVELVLWKIGNEVQATILSAKLNPTWLVPWGNGKKF